jgi:CRISPR-associated exonuclease Cas4
MPNGTPATSERLYLEVTDLKQWTYCPRIVFYRYCLPAIRPVTYSMEAGIQAHEVVAALEERRSLRTYGVTEGERQFDVALRSERLGLSGRIDLVIRYTTPTGPEAIVVDYKLSEREAGPHFKLQLAAYGLMIEEAWGIPVRRAFLYHISQRRAEAIPLTPVLRRKVEQTVSAIHAAIAGEAIPLSPSSLSRCVSCEFRRFCNDVV